MLNKHNLITKRNLYQSPPRDIHFWLQRSEYTTYNSTKDIQFSIKYSDSFVEQLTNLQLFHLKKNLCHVQENFSCQIHSKFLSLCAQRDFFKLVRANITIFNFPSLHVKYFRPHKNGLCQFFQLSSIARR